MQVADIFLSFEMHENLVEQEKLRFSPRHGTTQAGQVVQLAKHAGKSGLAALVWTGDDDDAFRVLQGKIVADHFLIVKRRL